MRKASAHPPIRFGAGPLTYGFLALVGVTFIVGTIASYLQPGQSLFRSVRGISDVEIRTGTIRLAPDRDEMCRELAFDNRSGQVLNKGASPCPDPLLQRTTERPFQMIQQGFVKR